MLKVPPHALPHLIAAAEAEMARLKAVHEAVGDDWPADFDANDIWLFTMIVDALLLSKDDGSGEVFLSGKPLWFLLNILPDYAKANAQTLSVQELGALAEVYAQHPWEAPPHVPVR